MFHPLFSSSIKVGSLSQRLQIVLIMTFRCFLHPKFDRLRPNLCKYSHSPLLLVLVDEFTLLLTENVYIYLFLI